MRRLLSIILVVAVIFILSATNPERSEYIEWINHKTMDQSSNILEKGILSVAGKTIFDAGTSRKDYFLFSVYKTDFSEMGLGKITSIGIFNQFIALPSSKE
ncbi:DUF4359 domain-containing protein [Bacillus sp. FJAT-29814]|uniref:DUF4359 domain-containing protein n=1 Tax=Bacillus sp. FJAT-29814 TaxID=1729688 RepID=UPI00082C3B30|nr:DUF4359 domain-containing protein [Bacillus sp. FJAT-29814]